MDIIFNKIDALSDTEAKIIFEWLTDSSNHLYSTLCKGSEDKLRYKSWNDLKEKFNEPKVTRFTMYNDENFLGEFSISFDHPALLISDPKSVWFGIGIGNPETRRKGVGSKTMKFMEQQVKMMGGKRIEFGVFEYNEPAINFYKKLGYNHFKTLPEFTWWDGKWWSDLRFEKLIT